MKGKFIANRIETEFNTKTKKITKSVVKIEYQIHKIAKSQYLMKSYEPSTGVIDDILFVKNSEGYISASFPNGIDNLFFDSDNNLIHTWSDNMNSNGILRNAYAKLEKV
jgi:hypothetical protein